MVADAISASGGGQLLLQSSGGGGGGGIIGGIFLLLFFAVTLGVTLLQLAGMWKVFEKANQPGWGALVPILNIFYLLEIADKETWWLILFVIPGISIIASIVVLIDVAKNFGKGPGYGLGLVFLAPIFWPLLGFGDDKYVGDTSAGV